jgi:hypothetical protein
LNLDCSGYLHCLMQHTRLLLARQFTQHTLNFGSCKPLLLLLLAVARAFACAAAAAAAALLSACSTTATTSRAVGLLGCSLDTLRHGDCHCLVLAA